MKIHRNNYKSYTPEQLAEAANNGTLDIIETSIQAVVEIVKYIFSAIESRKLLKRKVEVLEQTMKAQQELNARFAKEIEDLNQKFF